MYGIYDKETSMISDSIRKMLRGEETSFTPAGQRWDYLYSEDAGRAFYLIGERGRDGAVYCVAADRPAALVNLSARCVTQWIRPSGLASDGGLTRRKR